MMKPLKFLPFVYRLQDGRKVASEEIFQACPSGKVDAVRLAVRGFSDKVLPFMLASADFYEDFMGAVAMITSPGYKRNINLDIAKKIFQAHLAAYKTAMARSRKLDFAYARSCLQDTVYPESAAKQLETLLCEDSGSIVKAYEGKTKGCFGMSSGQVYWV